MTQPASAGASGGCWDCHVHVFEPGAPALAGHYTPGPAALHEVEALAAAHGIEHLVLVQPSVYGTDNSVMERALRSAGGRHRGVAVVAADVDDVILDRLHEAGVRGVRFNLVSPIGNDATDLLTLAPRLRERGWHVQWYAARSHLPHIADLQVRTRLTFVLDHLAGQRVDEADTAQSRTALRQLAAAGCWVKLSGWYRLGAAEPYASVAPAIRRIADLFGERMVWGSDWPHTALLPSAQSRFASLLQPVREALDPSEFARCLEGGRLYGA